MSPRRQESTQPALHPLLSVDGPAGVRRSARNANQRRQGFSFSEQGFLDARPRASQRRNNLGPMMSDRRWGVDLSATALTESRLPILTNAVEDALKDVIESSAKIEEEVEESKEEKGGGEVLHSKRILLVAQLFFIIIFLALTLK